ncbi:dipeptidyl aminopeptidase/acylaminoacyl peptidase [Natronospira proteinivora]|uniref:Dipeptidyl aminopeptidase/acylaminoacyl peptidase n=1 Tax=Natronospira proteinivora TaxID=1807133 RepID=A0ABT1GA79_9GAMM|nr:S9 family peptidase [Natronospira proteinivora]MCP1728222.1 dipeptidyl aminopeptidase/acylaminoacyl peptidase [Natronospira proteinivora]
MERTINKASLLAVSFLFGLGLMACSPQDEDSTDRETDVESADEQGLPPIIDRAVFFDDPEISGGQLSPDGEWVSFIQPLDGVMNVWVKRRGEDFEDARPLTDDRDRPVRSHWWSRDARYVVFMQDTGGDENFRLYRVAPDDDVAEGERVPAPVNLTPYDDIQARVVSRPRNQPESILVAINDRDPRLHDVYWVDLDTAERQLVFENDDGVASFTADLDGELRLATRQKPEGGWEILRIDDGELSEEPVYTCTIDEECSPIRFHPDGERVYMISNAGDRDLTELVLFNPETGEEQQVDGDPEEEVDFGGAEFDPQSHELLATYYVGDRLRVYPRDEAFERDYERVREALEGDGDIYFGSTTEDRHLQLVSLTSDTDPGATYVYDRESGEVELLYRPRPNLPVEHLAEMKPIRYEARDGLEIPGYLTLPKGVPAENLPLVVNPHGGPWARDSWGYDASAQFLANRGYAVFQPNFRGSSGFGKAFLNAGNEEWGTGAMQHDITDGVNYLIEQGIADPDRIGIMGGSYGGYATLAGLAFTPDLYAAGVSIVGPSNIITLLESIPPYWGPIRQIFEQRVGDPDDGADRERLKAQSPLFSAEEIRAPLMVIQGANDPRVVQHESDQIVVAMRELDRPVEYLVAEDEGHGFARRLNRLAMYADVERFLAEHLGGRYQDDMPEDVADTLETLQVDVDTVELESEEN